jgi:hypothetical protein
MYRAVYLISVLLVAGSPTVFAADKVIQFSAEAVQTTPERGTVRAKVYVGEDAVRNEYRMKGQTFVEIVRTRTRDRILLNPSRKEYVIQPGGNVNLPTRQSKQDRQKPCDGVANVTCRLLGKEQVNGRAAEKWEFVQQLNGREVRSLHWIDVRKRFPVRQLFPDGTVSEMNLLGTEKLDGRVVEKWEVVTIRPDGQRMRSVQWHDDKLNMAIREELPGGYVRELKNIKPGRQAASLFRIPPDYREIKPPANAAAY